MSLEDTTSVARALSDLGRVRAIMALREGELCACHLVTLLDLAPSTVSKHMALLIEAGLVKARREGRWVFYRLPGEEAPPVIRHALNWLVESVGSDARQQQDRQKLLRIRREQGGCPSC